LCYYYQNENLIEIIRLFIAKGIKVNGKNKLGDNALIYLCGRYKNENLIDITRLLIEKGINVNCKNEDGDNALTLLCVRYKNENLIDVITLLIKSGFKVAEETRDFFKRNYKGTNRTEILQLLHV
jgi:ankyrin repeat protein